MCDSCESWPTPASMYKSWTGFRTEAEGGKEECFLFLLLLLLAEARLSSPEGEALVHQEPVQPLRPALMCLGSWN